MAYDVEVKFGGDSTDAIKSIQSLHKELETAFSGISSVVEKIKSRFIALSGVFAGGYLFKEAVQGAEQLGLEMGRLATRLGVSTQEASVLRIALGSIGMSTDDYAHMLQRLTIQVRHNESEMNRLGVVTRDANGEYLNGQQLIKNVTTALLEYKEGQDRNIVSSALVGRNWAQFSEILRLTDARMKEARETADKLGLAIGPEQVEKARAYQKAMAAVGEVFAGMGNAAGNIAMPKLTALGEWFSTKGELMVEIARRLTNGVSNFTGALGKFGALASGDLSKLSPFLEKAPSTSGADAGLSGPMNFGAEGSGGAGGAGGGKSAPPMGISSMELWRAELEKTKMATSDFYKESHSTDLIFWKEKLKTVREGSKEYMAIEHEIYTLTRGLAQQGETEAKAFGALEMERARNDLREKITIAEQLAERVAMTEGKSSAAYINAMREKMALERQYHEMVVKLEDERLTRETQRSMAGLERARSDTTFKVQMGQIRETEGLQREMAIDEAEHDLQVKSLNARLALYQDDKLKQKEIRDEMGKVEDEYMKKVQQNTQQTTLAIKRYWDTIFSGITSTVASSIEGILLHTSTMHDLLVNVSKSLLTHFIDMGVKIAANWASSQIAMLATTTTTEAAKKAVSTAAAVEGMAVNKAAAAVEITDYAGAAAAAAMASVAAIPFTGWALAPEVGAATFAEAMSYLSVLSAEQGAWRIGENQLMYLHKNETVLPGDAAEGFRKMAEGGGMGETHLHVHAIDGKSVERFFSDNGRHVAKALQDQARLFATAPSWRK